MLLIRLLASLPLFVLYRLSDLLGWLAYRFYRRKIVWQNLEKAFPDKTPQERGQIARHFYVSLSDVVVETLKALTISEKELKKRVSLKSYHLLNDSLLAGQAVVVMTSHQGNWEWLLLRGGLDVVTQIDGVYKALSNPFFNKLMQQIRGRFNTALIEMRSLPRSLVSRRQVPRAIALVADQAPSPETAYWTTFLHQDTAFYTGPAKMALTYQYPVLFMNMKRLRRGNYEIETFEVAAPPYEGIYVKDILEKYVQLAEASIRSQPESWLWSHKRWKHRRPSSLS
jgi:KDO2-lipid IV(A) lauroyltransferase